MSTTRGFFVALETLARMNAVDIARDLLALAQAMLDDLECDDTARRLLAEALPDWDFDQTNEG